MRNDSYVRFALPNSRWNMKYFSQTIGSYRVNPLSSWMSRVFLLAVISIIFAGCDGGTYQRRLNERSETGANQVADVAVDDGANSNP